MSRRALGIAGLLVLVAFGTWMAWSFVIDDAFITFRYSQHLAEGYGPVWNVGGDPVEGFTNFGWMAWHALAAWLRFDLVLVAKVTSLVLAVLILVMLLRATEGAGSVVAALAFVLFVPTYFHIAGGLETVAFAAVVLRAAIVGTRVIEGERVWDWEPPTLLLVAGLLRPEGVLATLPAVAVWFFYERQRQGPKRWLIAAAVLGLGYFVWRWVYYGHPLPNTFYVKFGNLDAGVVWTQDTVLLFAPLLLLTLSLLAWRDARWHGLLLLGTVLATCVTYALSGPTMDFLARFAYHAFPVLCLGAGLAVAQFGHRWLAVAAGAVAVGWVTVLGARLPGLPVVANYGVDLHRAHVAIGQGLARANADVPREFRTVAVSDAGAIPYFSDWRSIDYLGLNDEAIAHGADPTEVVRKAQPMVIVVTSNGPQVPGVKYGMRVRVVTEGYTHVAAVRMRQDYWQHVFVVRGWAPGVGAAIEASVTEAQRTYDPGRYELTIDRWLDRLSGRTGS